MGQPFELERTESCRHRCHDGSCRRPCEAGAASRTGPAQLGQPRGMTFFGVRRSAVGLAAPESGQRKGRCCAGVGQPAFCLAMMAPARRGSAHVNMGCGAVVDDFAIGVR
jgi:hypothetical protein